MKSQFIFVQALPFLVSIAIMRAMPDGEVKSESLSANREPLTGALLEGRRRNDEMKLPTTLRSGYLLPALRRERNPSEAKIFAFIHELTFVVFREGR